MTTIWGIAPVVRLLPPGREIDGRTTIDWALVIGDGLSNQAVIEGTREELFRFAVCVGAAAELDGYQITPSGRIGDRRYRLTTKALFVTGGRRAG